MPSPGVHMLAAPFKTTQRLEGIQRYAHMFKLWIQDCLKRINVMGFFPYKGYNLIILGYDDKCMFYVLHFHCS